MRFQGVGGLGRKESGLVVMKLREPGRLVSVFINVNSSCKVNHIIFVLLGCDYFTKENMFQFHLFLYKDMILFPLELNKTQIGWAVVIYAFNPSTWEAEAG